jgi:hypothetical protein
MTETAIEVVLYTHWEGGRRKQGTEADDEDDDDDKEG